MNKKLMILGLCMMGAFSAVQADEQETNNVETTTTIAETTTISDNTTVATSTDTVVDEKDKDCGCKH